LKLVGTGIGTDDDQLDTLVERFGDGGAGSFEEGACGFAVVAWNGAGDDYGLAVEISTA